MSNRQVLCFKLSYSLGVTDGMLRTMYSSLYPIVTELNYLSGKEHVKKYRILMRCYYLMIRHYDVYRKAKHIWDINNDQLAEFVDSLDVTVDIDELFQTSNNLDDVINIFAREANNLLADVYREMEFGLCFSDFFTLTHVPVLSRLQILQVQFMLRQVPSTVNIYFFAHELLNLDCKNMLMSDSYLVRRLSLVTGIKQGRVQDRSALGLALKKMDDSAFLRLDDILGYNKVLVDCYSVREAQSLLSESILIGIRSLTYCRDCDECVRCLTSGDTYENTLIITHRTEEKLDSLQKFMNQATFLVPMPIPRATYRRILQRSWKNVYLLSLREDPDVVG